MWEVSLGDFQLTTESIVDALEYVFERRID